MLLWCQINKIGFHLISIVSQPVMILDKSKLFPSFIFPQHKEGMLAVV